MSTLKTTNLQNASAASPAIVLAADGSATANLSSVNGGPLGTRSRLINGGFDIWQRGTSQTTTGYGSADRWNMTVAGTCTFAQETSVIPSGAQYALKWTTGAGSSYGQVRQYIEQLNVIPLRGQTVTASAYVRSGGTFTGNYLFEIAYNTSSDASGAGWSTIATTTSGTINSSSYTQIKATFTVPSNAVGLIFGLVPDTVQASGAIVYQSLAQLEPGSTATPFERRSYGQELALCQRYYSKSFAASLAGPVAGNYDGNMGWGQSVEAAAVSMSVRFPVEMRATPTVTIYSPTSATAGTFRVWQAAVDRNGSAGFISSSGFSRIDKSGAADLGPSNTQNSAVHWIASIEL